MAGTQGCHRCGHVGHTVVNCMVKDTKKHSNPLRKIEEMDQLVETPAQARGYACTSKDTGKSDIVVIGTISILGHYSFTLLKSCSTHSFISMPLLYKQGSIRTLIA